MLHQLNAKLENSMTKKWDGDGIHRLPSKQVEPYRLWFEFLSLAAKDPTLSIDETVYKNWGDYRGLKFTPWWTPHWRTLFAVDIGVRILEPADIAHSIDPHSILLRVPRYQSKQKTLRQIADLLETEVSERLAAMPAGQFRLDCGTDRTGQPIDPAIRFLRNLDKVRLLMHLYRFWLQHPSVEDRTRIEETAKSYFAWASAWNTRVREKNWKRDLIEIPPAIRTYCEFLERRGERRRMTLYDSNDSDWASARSQIARYIRKARRLAGNTARGQFPGQYE